MKTPNTSFLLAALLSVFVTSESHAQTTAITYQGRLTTNGGPANGSHDFQFTLFAAPSGGNPVEDPVALSAVGVTNGLFTVALDYGANVFNGRDRWLAIAVRPAGSGAFTPLNPRQPITPTPYAVTALNVPGISGSSLNSANNGPLNVVVVDNFGKVGVGTTSPQETLDVRSGDGSYVRVDNVNGDLKVNGGSDGHFGIFNAGPSSGGTHLIGEGQSRLFVANTGNVGIGTTTPNAKLDVRGDIRLGPGGELRAASGEESLRIIRGVVAGDGTILQGAGFSVTRVQLGRYRINFLTPFASPPSLTASAEDGVGTTVARYQGVTANSGLVFVSKNDAGTFSYFDGSFSFTAIGPR